MHLAFTRPLTVSLQRCNEVFQSLWKRTDISQSLGITPTKKRTVSQQQNHSHPIVSSLEQHYCVAYFNEFIDHIMVHLDNQFPDNLENALIATSLLLLYLPELTPDIMTKIMHEFENILLSPFVEVSTWKVHTEQLQFTDDFEKTSLVYACILAVKYQTYYPNIYSILSLLLALPVGSCTCERSFSS